MNDDQKPQLDTASVAENTSSHDEAPQANRRDSIRRGISGLAAMVLAACSGTDFSSASGDRKKGSKAKNPDAGDGFGDDGTDDAGPDSGDDGLIDVGGTSSGEGGDDDDTDIGGTTDECSPFRPQTVDLSNIPQLAPAPAVVIYGKEKSRMVCVKFAADFQFEQLLLVRPDGKVLAMHIPNPGDQGPSGWRPIVIDNLNFNTTTEAEEVAIVVQLANGRFQHRAKLESLKMFKNKPVVDLTTPDQFDPNFQCVARFTDTTSTYRMSDPKTPYPGNRKLKSFVMASKLTPASDAIVSTGKAALPLNTSVGYLTDIMGNEILPSAITDAAILETPLFCTYIPSGDGSKYYRTMIHVA
jgi:hypothetical protein